MAAARHCRFWLRPGVSPRWTRQDLRRDDINRKARSAAARLGAFAPRPRLRQTGGDLPVSESPHPNPKSELRSSRPPQAGEGEEKGAFGVYVHWPFCLSKCPYCDFNSHVRHAPIDEDRFALAFAREIETTAARAPGREVSSIFLGGGTPSLMRPQTVGSILDSIARHWRA